MNLSVVARCPHCVTASALKNTANELILMGRVISIADLLRDGVSSPMLGALSCGLHTPLFLFRDKDKRTSLKASFQPQVSDSYYTVLPCREYFKENYCHAHDNLSKKTGQEF